MTAGWAIMRRMLPTRGAAALLAAVLVLATACSTDGAGGATGGGTPSSSGSPTGAGPTGPPPSADPDVLDRPEVRAVEQWAAGYARAVNRSDQRFASTTELATPGGRGWMERNARSEWGRYFPGPLPVTPLSVRRVDDTHREVTACVTVSGWTWASRTSRRARSREVIGATVRMVRTSGRWRFDGMSGVDLGCAGVDARPRRW